MAGSKSNQFETDFLNWAYTAGAVTRPAAWYVALLTDAAGLVADQPATEATTANCPGYARQQVTSWTVSGNQAQNATDVTFSPSGSWATVNYMAVFDAPTGGRMLHWASMAPATADATHPIEFKTNSITFNED